MPESITRYTDAQIDALRELANIGSGNASIALERLIGRPIDLSVPTVELFELADAVAAAGAPEADRYGIIVPISGDFQARMLLLLDPVGASVLFGVFDLAPGSPEARSMLAEIGNILSSYYVVSMARAVGMDVDPGPPQIVVDMLAAIIGTALLGDGSDGDHALLLDSHLGIEDADFDLDILLIGATGAVEAIIERLNV